MDDNNFYFYIDDKMYRVPSPESIPLEEWDLQPPRTYFGYMWMHDPDEKYLKDEEFVLIESITWYREFGIYTADTWAIRIVETGEQYKIDNINRRLRFYGTLVPEYVEEYD